jgi:outer membrane protein TolC
VRLFVYWLILCLWLCHPTKAQTAPSAPPTLSLKQAVALALQKHPSLTRMDETRRAAEAREQAEASAFLPRLTFEAVGKEGPTSAPGFGFSGLVNSTIVRNYGASVVLSQMLYDFGRALHRTRSRRFAASAAGADEQAQRAVVTLSVYQAYNGALLVQQPGRLAPPPPSPGSAPLRFVSPGAASKPSRHPVPAWSPVG